MMNIILLFMFQKKKKIAKQRIKKEIISVLNVIFMFLLKKKLFLRVISWIQMCVGLDLIPFINRTK